ncbi:hypothetical protein [Mycolicibacterium tokaiense]|uniref:Uncharacterized protein n=1 Tax=Mycolicibacterium tokaiense TaxID=39695 RepID=A0A379PP49_9MYCO|nr:hypothetical protein [Mycolicibacterium tokaiense]SUE94959.1 Uncharacterised protein [Mycolicibacterium tokaiense]
MIASVTGINFYNKGAELMAYAVSQEYSSWGEGFIPAAHLGIGTFGGTAQSGGFAAMFGQPIGGATAFRADRRFWRVQAMFSPLH